MKGSIVKIKEAWKLRGVGLKFEETENFIITQSVKPVRVKKDKR